LGLSYDSGNYEPTLDRAVEMIDATGFRKQQAELRRKGIYRGLGISSYVEIAGLAPSRFIGPKGIGLKGGLWESSLVRVHPSGSITVFTGCSPHGQGHETSFSQIMADRLGATPDQVRVLYGDTDTGPYGLGTYGSRTLSVGGEAAARAADKVADKARQIAAHMLEAAPGDIELRGGKYGVKGVPGRSTTLADIAGVAHVAADLPDGAEPGLEAEVFYDPSNFVFPFGTHACIVEVDAQTGKVSILRWVAVDDCGVAVNPMLVEGQVHGGITHAIGQALYEQIVYSPEGQLTSGTFVDYTLPTASDVPLFEVDRTETPSPVNELQVKGVGEAGTIPATAALVNAVVDALRPLGITFLNMPLSMLRVHEAIEAARQKSAPAVE
jgi:carbon-monoxide dehydrogenase large subunit